MRRDARRGMIVGGCAAGLLGLWVLALVTLAPRQGGGTTATASTAPWSPSTSEVWSFCRDEMAAKLRAPGSAHFAGIADGQVARFSDGRFLVTSYVDSQNGFGALLRTDYRCTVEPVPEAHALRLGGLTSETR